LSGLVEAAVQAAEYGTEEARSVISAIIKSIAMYIQQIAAWLQSVISYVIEPRRPAPARLHDAPDRHRHPYVLIGKVF